MLGNDGAAIIGDLVGDPRCSITTILMSSNHVGDKGALAMAEGLRRGVVVEQLYMGCEFVCAFSTSQKK